jgi:hypothetical protein
VQFRIQVDIQAEIIGRIRSRAAEKGVIHSKHGKLRLKYMMGEPQDTDGSWYKYNTGGRRRIRWSVDVAKWHGGSSPRWPNVVAKWQFACTTRVWTLHLLGGLKFERPWSNLCKIFYYTLNVFIGKNASKVASIDETGHWD